VVALEKGGGAVLVYKVLLVTEGALALAAAAIEIPVDKTR